MLVGRYIESGLVSVLVKRTGLSASMADPPMRRSRQKELIAMLESEFDIKVELASTLLQSGVCFDEWQG